jgi:hypothetical protein
MRTLLVTDRRIDLIDWNGDGRMIDKTILRYDKIAPREPSIMNDHARSSCAPEVSPP